MSSNWACRAAVVLAPALGLIFTTPAVGGSVRYRVLDLGVLANQPDAYSRGFALNNAGQVVGTSPGPGFIGDRAFRTRPNSPIRPEDMLDAGAGESLGFGLNDLGQAVGFIDTVDPLVTFRTAPNAPVNRATDNIVPLVSSPAQVRDINNAGQVVGAMGWVVLGEPSRAYRTGPNAVIDPTADNLGTLGGAESFALAINDAGVAVGWAQRADGTRRAFRVPAGRAIDPTTDDLGSLGGADSTANDINGAGQVVGAAATTSGAQHAFRTAASDTIQLTDDLGVLPGTVASAARSINARGDVVGMSYGEAPSNSLDSHAFVFLDGEMFDLNDQTDAAGATVWLYEAVAINDRGQILANAIFANQFGRPGRAVLLTPTAIPIPPAIVPCVIGLARVTAVVRRSARRTCEARS